MISVNETGLNTVALTKASRSYFVASSLVVLHAIGLEISAVAVDGNFGVSVGFHSPLLGFLRTMIIISLFLMTLTFYFDSHNSFVIAELTNGDEKTSFQNFEEMS